MRPGPRQGRNRDINATSVQDPHPPGFPDSAPGNEVPARRPYGMDGAGIDPAQGNSTMDDQAPTTAAPDRPGDPRWARILARDRTADGTFWYSVVTTGVYCRPSCPSRACNPGNVVIHDSLEAARATGCRACLRCRPDEPRDGAAAAVALACRLIDEAGQAMPLAALADAVGLGPQRLHRAFKAATGVTPRAFAAARRASRLRDRLAEGGTVTAAIQDAGYGSSGRFYAEAGGVLGMTPRRYRAGGAGEVLRFAATTCSLGAILVASSARGIAAILLGDDPDRLLRELRDRFPRARLVDGDEAFGALLARVVGFVETPSAGLDLPLDIRGTAFQQRVWQALRQVPVGDTASYAEIASRLGVPGAARAVAGACAANPLAVAVPCHRVVRQGGALSGYRWGVARKRALLDREGAQAAPCRPEPDRAP